MSDSVPPLHHPWRPERGTNRQGKRYVRPQEAHQEGEQVSVRAVPTRLYCLKFWKYNQPTNEPKDTDLDNNNVLDPMETISDTFKDNRLKKGCIYIIIKVPSHCK